MTPPRNSISRQSDDIDAPSSITHVEQDVSLLSIWDLPPCVLARILSSAESRERPRSPHHSALLEPPLEDEAQHPLRPLPLLEISPSIALQALRVQYVTSIPHGRDLRRLEWLYRHRRDQLLSARPLVDLSFHYDARVESRSHYISNLIIASNAWLGPQLRTLRFTNSFPRPLSELGPLPSLEVLEMASSHAPPRFALASPNAVSPIAIASPPSMRYPGPRARRMRDDDDEYIMPVVPPPIPLYHGAWPPLPPANRNSNLTPIDLRQPPSPPRRDRRFDRSSPPGGGGGDGPFPSVHMLAPLTTFPRLECLKLSGGGWSMDDFDAIGCVTTLKSLHLEQLDMPQSVLTSLVATLQRRRAAAEAARLASPHTPLRLRRPEGIIMDGGMNAMPLPLPGPDHHHHHQQQQHQQQLAFPNQFNPLLNPPNLPPPTDNDAPHQALLPMAIEPIDTLFTPLGNLTQLTELRISTSNAVLPDDLLLPALRSLVHLASLSLMFFIDATPLAAAIGATGSLLTACTQLTSLELRCYDFDSEHLMHVPHLKRLVLLPSLYNQSPVMNEPLPGLRFVGRSLEKLHLMTRCEGALVSLVLRAQEEEGWPMELDASLPASDALLASSMDDQALTAWLVQRQYQHRGMEGEDGEGPSTSDAPSFTSSFDLATKAPPLRDLHLSHMRIIQHGHLLGQLSHLTRLALSSTTMTDGMAQSLTRLPLLESLLLTDTSDHLKRLDLFSAVSALPRLTRLVLRNIPVFDDDTAHLFRHLTSLTSLEVPNAALRSGSLAHFAPLKRLRHLDLSMEPRSPSEHQYFRPFYFTDDLCLRVFGGMENLTSLHVGGRGVSTEVATQLRGALPLLRDLRIRG